MVRRCRILQLVPCRQAPWSKIHTQSQCRWSCRLFHRGTKIFIEPNFNDLDFLTRFAKARQRMDIWRALCGSSSKRFTTLYCFILIIQAAILQLPDSPHMVIVLLYSKIYWILVSQAASDSTSLLQSPSPLVISSTRTFVRSIRQTSELSCSNLGGQYLHGPPNFSYMGAPSTHGGKRIS